MAPGAGAGAKAGVGASAGANAGVGVGTDPPVTGAAAEAGGNWGRRAFYSIYAPAFMLALAQGLMVPMLPLYARTFGVSDGLVAVASAALATGTLLADVPSGLVMEKIGRRPAMLLGTTAVALAALGSGLAPAYPVLLLCQVLAGVGAALWGISRLAYITDVVPIRDRGRILSTFGGVNRIGTFGGPAAGGLIGVTFGLNVPFILGGVLALGAMLLAFRYVHESARPAGAGKRSMRWRLVGGIVKDHAPELSTAGAAQIFAQMIRSGRTLLIPLYGATVLNLDAAQIGTIVSLAAALDMAMFVPAGWLMDRFGRKAAAVPSFIVMALGMLLVPLAGDFLGLLFAAGALGFGNGLGSGTMMTLGADLAPREAVGEFLGVWRLIGDIGAMTGPLMVGAMAEKLGLGPAAYLLSGIGMLAASTLVVFVRETLQRDEAT